MKKGFTLIELLIVVAIIAILAAIAVPNFLEAQTRSKVSRTKADIRSIMLAMESYRVDNQKYQPFIYPGTMIGMPYRERFVPLTTPIAYIASVPQDVFQTGPLKETFGASPDRSFIYDGIDGWPDEGWYTIWGLESRRFKYDIRSFGPDLDSNDYNWKGTKPGLINYDPTNGTVSQGDIVYFGPGGGFDKCEGGTVGN
jgi:type II secretion system protein G